MGLIAEVFSLADFEVLVAILVNCGSFELEGLVFCDREVKLEGLIEDANFETLVTTLVPCGRRERSMYLADEVFSFADLEVLVAALVSCGRLVTEVRSFADFETLVAALATCGGMRMVGWTDAVESFVGFETFVAAIDTGGCILALVVFLLFPVGRGFGGMVKRCK